MRGFVFVERVEADTPVDITGCAAPAWRRSTRSRSVRFRWEWLSITNGLKRVRVRGRSAHAAEESPTRKAQMFHLQNLERYEFEGGFAQQSRGSSAQALACVAHLEQSQRDYQVSRPPRRGSPHCKAQRQRWTRRTTQTPMIAAVLARGDGYGLINADRAGC